MRVNRTRGGSIACACPMNAALKSNARLPDLMNVMSFMEICDTNQKRNVTKSLLSSGSDNSTVVGVVCLKGISP